MGTLAFWRMPLLAAALAFAAGELCSLHWQWLAAAPYAFALLGLLTLAALRFAPRVAPVAVLGLWAAAGCWCVQMQPGALPAATIAPYADGLSRTLVGRIDTLRRVRPAGVGSEPPEPALPAWQQEPGAWENPAEGPAVSVDLQLLRIEQVTPDRSMMVPIHDALTRVTLLGATPALHCGETLQMPARLKLPEPYRDPGVTANVGLQIAGVAATAAVQGNRIKIVSSGEVTARCRLDATREWLRSRLDALAMAPTLASVPRLLRFNATDSAAVAALVLGDRGAVSHDDKLDLERTGTFHLVVASGLQVAVIAAALWWLLRRMGLPEWLSAPAVLAAATAYAALAGFTTPVRRALLMVSVVLLGRVLLRRVSAPQTLGAAMLLVLLLDPRALFTASFQMSFLVVLAVIGLGVPLAERLLGGWKPVVRTLGALWPDLKLPPPIAARRVWLRLWLNALNRAFGPLPARGLLLALRGGIWLVEYAIVSIVAEAAMSLPMAVYFHRATPLAFAANLLLAPLAAPALLLAAITALLAAADPWVAAVPSTLCALLLGSLRWGTATLGSLPAAEWRTPGPRLALAGLAVAALLAACALAHTRGRLSAWMAALLIGCVPAAAFWPGRSTVVTGALEVTALDVGQGDSLLVVAPDGAALLVDAGGPVGAGGRPAERSASWDVGEQVVAPVLWHRGFRRLDAVLLTHAHSDHLGGLPAVLRDFRPRELWISMEPGNSPALQQSLQLARKLGVRVRHFAAGDGFVWHGVQTSVLSPELSYANAGEARNDDSLVMRLDFGAASVLLEGDAERPSEDTMLANGRLDAVTLLKVGHHGSRTSTNPEFVDVVRPRMAVISDGRRNTFGHPRAEVLARLEAMGTRVWRTDRAGATTFLLRPDGGIAAAPAASNP